MTARVTDRPAALQPGWLPADGPPWLCELRTWHRGQLRAWRRCRAALALVPGDEGLVEDERLAAEELARIIGVVVEAVAAHEGDGVGELGAGERDAARARAALRVDQREVVIA